MCSQLASSVVSADELVETLTKTSKMASRPDFLGPIDKKRLIGGFGGDLTEGDKLALQAFMAREFGLQQIEVLRSMADVVSVLERYARLCLEVDLLCFDVAVLRDCDPELVLELLRLLSPRGIVCVQAGDKIQFTDIEFSPLDNLQAVMSVPGFCVFAQINGTRHTRSLRYQIDLFLRKRYVASKRRSRVGSEPDVPDVAVFILTYNHGNFIEECLRSIMMQRGRFNIRVLIIDDSSPDNTAQIARSVIAENRDNRIKFELRVNPQNVGASANWGPALRWAEGADFVALCDGDDFWSSEYRIQEHIDFLREHPDALMSFNSFEFCAPDGSGRRPGIRLEQKIVGADRMILDNPVGHLGSTFYRGELVEIFPLEPFDHINGDWKINVYCSQIGKIGYIDKMLSVYRLHGGSTWSNKTLIDRISPTIKSSQEFNYFTDFSYDREYSRLILNNYIYLDRLYGSLPGASGFIDLIVLGGEFPEEGSFQYVELASYLESFPSSIALFTSESKFKHRFPKIACRVMQDDGRFPIKMGKQIYAPSLDDIFNNISRVETAGVPFIFSLFAGENVIPEGLDIQMKMRSVFSSPFFRYVIVSNDSTRDYLINEGFCTRGKIKVIFGGAGVEPPSGLAPPKRRWGDGKARLDICVIAPHFAADCRDMSCGLLVEVGKALQKRHNDVFLHVVGASFSRVDDFAALGDRIKFYGSLGPREFDRFFRDIDIILSFAGGGRSVQGPPSAIPCKNIFGAGVRGAAIFSTKQLMYNNDAFEDGKNIVFIEPLVEDIVNKIDHYCVSPRSLKALGERGAQTLRDLSCPRSQIQPRIDLLRFAIRYPRRRKLTLPNGIVVLRAELALRDEQIAAMRAELALRDEQIAAMRASTSWRLSALIRFAGHVTRGDLTTAGKVIHFAVARMKAYVARIARVFGSAGRIHK